MKLPPSALKRIAARCHTLHDHFYVPAKLNSDPVYEAVARELAPRPFPVLDIGCGVGLLTHYLREGGTLSPITSLDYDHRKIASARAMAKVAGYEDVTFGIGDARRELPEHLGHVVILDILQFMPATDQADLLRLAASRVAPGGKCIIRSCLRDDSRRYRITVLGDWFAKATFWMKHAPVAYPTAEEFHEVLSGAGLKVTIQPLWGGTPFNNPLVVLER